jgi:hypothetical protein
MDTSAKFQVFACRSDGIGEEWKAKTSGEDERFTREWADNELPPMRSDGARNEASPRQLLQKRIMQYV